MAEPPAAPGCRPTWHLMSMLKNSSPGSWGSPSPRRWPRLLWVMRSPGRLPTLARWSSRRRLWELAMRSKNSSVWGEAVSEGWAAGHRGSGPGRQGPSPLCPRSPQQPLCRPQTPAALSHSCRGPDARLEGLQGVTEERAWLPTPAPGPLRPDTVCSGGWGDYTFPGMQLWARRGHGVHGDREHFAAGPPRPRNTAAEGGDRPRPPRAHQSSPPGWGRPWLQQPRADPPPGDSAGHPCGCSGTCSAGQRSTPRRRTGPGGCSGGRDGQSVLALGQPQVALLWSPAPHRPPDTAEWLLGLGRGQDPPPPPAPPAPSTTTALPSLLPGVPRGPLLATCVSPLQRVPPVPVQLCSPSTQHSTHQCLLNK